MSKKIYEFIQNAVKDSQGILHLSPTWVPRSFLVPGRRLKLYPDDIYALGVNRGGIDERWFASTIKANNGPNTPKDEGLSYIISRGEKITLKDSIEFYGSQILGDEIMNKFGGWKVYSKFFDNMEPIPHHLHQMDIHAKDVGMEGKPEAYYFPPQLNAIENAFPYTFFGLEPGTEKRDIISCIKNWNKGDNGILKLSKAYRLEPETGWLLPPGILHAPGTLVTYEVQWASDILSLFQSMVNGREIDKNLLTVNVPKEKSNDYDYITNMIDWGKNTIPDFKAKYFRRPKIVKNSIDKDYIEKWIVYGLIEGIEYFSAKELTVKPKSKVKVYDNGPYSLVVIQGVGYINGNLISSPSMIRYGDITDDEHFVINEAAKEGVIIENLGNENLVILKCFGPGENPDMPPA